MKTGFDCIGLAAVTLCHDGKGKYLVGLRSKNCRDEKLKWDAVGSGAVEFGDTIEQTIHKEIKEECDAEVVSIEKLGSREVFRVVDNRDTHWISHDFLVEINPDQVKINEPDKCLELRWCTIEEIPLPRHSQFPVFLEKYKNKL
jgi:ADP-ribose pyrophosphatase YjhB (NUDIX family)